MSGKPSISPREGRRGILASARAAFSSWWAVLAVIASSVAGFNLVRNLFRVQLSQVFAEVLHNYQKLFHVPVLWLFEQIHWPKPQAWMIDVSVLWFLVGGIVLRTYLAILAQADSPMRKQMYSDLIFGSILGKLLPPVVWVALSPILWPYMLHVLANRVLYDAPEERGSAGKLILVSREILAWQALASVTCLGTWFALNALLELYG